MFNEAEVRVKDKRAGVGQMHGECKLNKDLLELFIVGFLLLHHEEIRGGTCGTSQSATPAGGDRCTQIHAAVQRRFLQDI
jgi:hypothetical protein